MTALTPRTVERRALALAALATECPGLGFAERAVERRALGFAHRPVQRRSLADRLHAVIGWVWGPSPSGPYGPAVAQPASRLRDRNGQLIKTKHGCRARLAG